MEAKPCNEFRDLRNLMILHWERSPLYQSSSHTLQVYVRSRLAQAFLCLCSNLGSLAAEDTKDKTIKHKHKCNGEQHAPGRTVC